MPTHVPLTRETLLPDPFDQFSVWFKDAEKAVGLELAEAMCLSTVDAEGFPDGRMVLLKSYTPEGFVFYTNTHSIKGRELNATPKAALTFHWSALERQVRVQGTIRRVSDSEADAYFASRARLSQIGAWASDQSAVLSERAVLDDKVAELTRRFEGKPVPRPEHWTGLRLIPFKIEFWQAHPNRLHDRFVFQKDAAGAWTISRLYP